MSCPKCNYNSGTEDTPFCPECEAAIVTVPKPAAQIEVTQDVGTVEGGQLVGVDLGEVQGDVSIGNYTLRIGTLNGGVVNLAPPQQQQPPRARPAPVRLLPRKSPGLLDRKQETSIATSTLLSASPAEFHGPPGIGKTKLLRHLAYQEFASACPDGVVCLSAVRRKPVEDVLLDLFDAFYERETTYKPTAVQVRYSLQDTQALIILDDIDLERDEVAALMDAAPSCTFLLASTECCLWGEGRALALSGLPLEDALVLIERELGRSLGADERYVAEDLCAALGGHPLRLMQLAALVREAGRSLADLSSQLHWEEIAFPAKALTEQALSACSEQEKQILAVLAISRGASLGKEHVKALTGIEEIDAPIESLKRRKLAQSHSPRYSLTGSLGSTLEEQWDLTPWNEHALEHFAAWAEQHRQNPQLINEETEAILEILRWALREQRWEGAQRLGRAVEGALAVSGQWGAWAQVLSWQYQAARELGDGAAQAWALHQSGTRALCLEHPSTAQTDLTEALRIRESLGDWAGAAVTRHNLDLFFGGPGGSSGPQGNGSGGNGSGAGGGWPIPRLGLWLGALGVALIALGLSSSAILSLPRPLDSNDFREPAVQLLGPTGQLLEPAVQLLEPAMQPTSSDSSPITPWFKPDPNTANSSDPVGGSGSGGSGTKTSDDSRESSGSDIKPSGDSSESSGSDTKSPGEDSDSGDASTKSGDAGSSDTKSPNDGSDVGGSSGNKSSDTKSPSEKAPPGTTDPEPTDPEPTTPEPTDSEPSTPSTTHPGKTNPGTAYPGKTDPEPTTHEPTDPEPTEPEPTTHEPTTHEPTDPEPTDPEPTTPEPTTPEPTTPEPTTPEPATPAPIDPGSYTPQPPGDVIVTPEDDGTVDYGACPGCEGEGGFVPPK